MKKLEYKRPKSRSKGLQIILASRSQARRELLERFGIRVKVIPACVVEKKDRGRMSYSELVRYNALAKARDTAGKVKQGIVVAADTIVVQNSRIFGKPSDLAEAKRLLKCLSGKRQFLYTGVAVVDSRTARELSTCEKTCLFMDSMTDLDMGKVKRKQPRHRRSEFKPNATF